LSSITKHKVMETGSVPVLRWVRKWVH